jgi:hypothetical protein
MPDQGEGRDRTADRPFAWKTWPRAIWIIGEGSNASVSRCPPGETVMLFGTMAEADSRAAQFRAANYQWWGKSASCTGHKVPAFSAPPYAGQALLVRSIF